MSLSSFVFRSIDVLTKRTMNPKHLQNVKTIPGNQYDLYYCGEHTDQKPIIVNIHGGGFVAGDKKYRRYWCELLAQDDWFVININYRLCSEFNLIEQIQDAWQTFTQVNTIAQQYHLDTSTLVVTGDSSGAFLAAYLVALQHDQSLRELLKIANDVALRITGALLFCGVYDLVAMLKTKYPLRRRRLMQDMAAKMIGVNLRDQQALTNYPYYSALSITPWINQDWCPVQLFYATHDMFVRGQGELFYQALQDHHVPVRCDFSQQWWPNHGYQFFFRTKASKRALAIARDFLTKMRTHTTI